MLTSGRSAGVHTPPTPGPPTQGILFPYLSVSTHNFTSASPPRSLALFLIRFKSMMKKEGMSPVTHTYETWPLEAAYSPARWPSSSLSQRFLTRYSKERKPPPARGWFSYHDPKPSSISVTFMPVTHHTQAPPHLRASAQGLRPSSASHFSSSTLLVLLSSAPSGTSSSGPHSCFMLIFVSLRLPFLTVRCLRAEFFISPFPTTVSGLPLALNKYLLHK